MCGRYQLLVSAALLSSAQPNTKWREGDDTKYVPRQQVRPTDMAPVLVAATDSSSAFDMTYNPLESTTTTTTSDDSTESMTMTKTTTEASPSFELVMMKWGFSQTSSAQPLINARSETICDLPTFRHASDKTRCAIPISGFYEWHRSSTSSFITPYLVKASNQKQQQQQQYIAGLYNGTAKTFVIVTTKSAKDFEWLHHRQPVFLQDEKQLHTWLDIKRVRARDAVRKIHAHDGGMMGMITTKMIRDLSAPAANNEKPRKQKSIASFFHKKNTNVKNIDGLKVKRTIDKKNSSKSGTSSSSKKQNKSEKQGDEES